MAYAFACVGFTVLLWASAFPSSRLALTAFGPPELAAMAVPQVAVLGEHVVLIGLMPDAFARLPPPDAAKFTPVEPTTLIRVGIVGRFH